jgi:hypothetical protein
MTEPENEELELLREARRQFTPAPDVASRVALAVARGIAPPATTGQFARGFESTTPSLPTAKVTLLGHGLSVLGGKAVLLSALALAGAIAGTTAVLPREPANRRVASPSASVSHTATLPRATVSAGLSGSTEPPGVPVVPITALERSAEAGPRTAHFRARDANQAAKAPVRLAFDAELAAVHAADSALAEGSPARALSILNALGPTQNGNLGEERTALDLVARCASAGAERAALVEQFLTQYSHSVYAARIRAACGQ